MATSVIGTYPKFHADDPATNTPLSGGKLYTYETGTTTNKTTYTDSAKTTAHANPIILDSNGEATIYLDGEYTFKLDKSDDTNVWTVDNINTQTVAASSVTGGNMLENPNFEVDSDADGLPDNWDVTVTGTVSLDTTDSDVGKQSMKFVSTGPGGGLITNTNKIPINSDKTIYTGFSIKASAVNLASRVYLHFYDKDEASLGTTQIHFDNATNPASWTRYEYYTAPNASAKYLGIDIYGCDPASSVSGTMRFDGIYVSQSNLTNESGDWPVGSFPQIADGINSVLTVLDVATDLTVNTWESVGPTGSGADNIYTELDDVPSGAIAVILKIYLKATKTTADGACGTVVYAESGDKTTPAAGEINKVAENLANVVNGNFISYITHCVVPVNSSNVFKMYWWRSSANETDEIKAYLVGWV